MQQEHKNNGELLGNQLLEGENNLITKRKTKISPANYSLRTIPMKDSIYLFFQGLPGSLNNGLISNLDKCACNVFAVISDPKLGWGSVDIQDLMIHEVEAYHGSILFEPRVKEVVEIMKHYLG